MARRKSTTTAAPAPEVVEETPPAEQITLVGRLVADPQLRHTTTTGKPVSNIRLAVTDGEETTFHRVVVWGRTAEVVCQYLRKGRRVEIEGRSQERTWRDSDGTEQTITEVAAYRVQFLGREPVAAEEKEVA